MVKKVEKIELNYLPGNVLLEHVFKQLHKPLIFYAYKFVEDENIAKDLVQDAFLSILNKKDDSKINDLKSFLYRCVRNNCLNYVNHKLIEKSFKENEAERINREIKYYDTHQTIVEKEMVQKLMAAIDELPDHYKIPLKLSRFENMKTKEIAKQLDIPIRSVETKIYRALNLLRSKLDKNMFTLFNLFYPKPR